MKHCNGQVIISVSDQSEQLVYEFKFEKSDPQTKFLQRKRHQQQQIKTLNIKLQN